MGNTDRHRSNDKHSITEPLHSHTIEATQITRPTYAHSCKWRTNQHLLTQLPRMGCNHESTDIEDIFHENMQKFNFTTSAATSN
eukprot:4484033-Amphidinium_carterae.2